MDAIDQLREDMNRLRGRLFQFVEALGMPGRQETAIKGMVRTLTYESQANLESLLRAHRNDRNGNDARNTANLP